MRAGLTGVLSEQAAKLYEQLIVTGGLVLAEHSDLVESSPARELIDSRCG